MMAVWHGVGNHRPGNRDGCLSALGEKPVDGRFVGWFALQQQQTVSWNSDNLHARDNPYIIKLPVKGPVNSVNRAPLTVS